MVYIQYYYTCGIWFLRIENMVLVRDEDTGFYSFPTLFLDLGWVMWWPDGTHKIKKHKTSFLLRDIAVLSSIFVRSNREGKQCQQLPADGSHPHGHMRWPALRQLRPLARVMLLWLQWFIRACEAPWDSGDGLMVFRDALGEAAMAGGADGGGTTMWGWGKFPS